MTRDFSEKAKQKLEGYADDAAASSTWGKIKDWFSDRGMDFQSWTGKARNRKLYKRRGYIPPEDNRQE